MVNFTILAGGFAVPGFIATYLFDSDASTLSLAANSSSGDSPSWIAQHPTNRSILYSVNEISPVGNLQSFTINADGSVTLVDTVTTGGNGPTFTNPLSTGEVSGMNFGSPNCSFVATDPNDPLTFRTDSPVLSFPVPEGAKSNPHMSLEFNGEVFVPDLGGDKIWRIVNDGAPGKFKVQGQIDQDPGTGPRHIAIHDNILFVLHETASTLTAQRIPEGPNGTALPLLANVSIIPQDAIEGGQFAAAELLISTPTDKFPNPLIYVSNRQINPNVTDPNGDTIAIFEFINGTSVDGGSGSGSGETGANGTATATGAASSSTPTANSASSCSKKKRMVKSKRHQPFSLPSLNRRQDSSSSNSTGPALNLIAQIPTGLQQIRSMALGRVDDGGDEFIIAGANTVGGVAVFRRTDGGRNLELVVRNEEVQNRTSFVFV